MQAGFEMSCTRLLRCRQRKLLVGAWACPSDDERGPSALAPSCHVASLRLAKDISAPHHIVTLLRGFRAVPLPFYRLAGPMDGCHGKGSLATGVSHCRRRATERSSASAG
jgi:hypothetical protein